MELFGELFEQVFYFIHFVIHHFFLFVNIDILFSVFRFLNLNRTEHMNLKFQFSLQIAIFVLSRIRHQLHIVSFSISNFFVTFLLSKRISF